MDYMFKAGFLGTKASFFMDITTLIVAFLPFLLIFAIYFAKKGKYKIHAFLQTTIYFVAVVVICYFEYGIRVSGGVKEFLKATTISHNYLFFVLSFHIIVAVIGFILWSVLIFNSFKREDSLVCSGCKKHKKDGKRVFIWITLTAMTGIWVYLLLFI